MTIQSNASVASSVATEIASSASRISGVGSATPDSVSEYQGNSDAAAHIPRVNTYSTQLASNLSQFVNLIHSTVEAFEAVDQSLSQTLSESMRIQATPADTVAAARKPLPYTGRLLE